MTLTGVGRSGSLRVAKVLRNGKRRFDPVEKEHLIDAALELGISIAGLALAHGINTNQLPWVKIRRERSAESMLTGMANSAPLAFVPVVAASPTERPEDPSSPTSPRMRLKASPPACGLSLKMRSPSSVCNDRSVGALRCSGWLTICASIFTGNRSTLGPGSTALRSWSGIDGAFDGECCRNCRAEGREGYSCAARLQARGRAGAGALHRFAPRSEKHVDRVFNEAEQVAVEDEAEGDDIDLTDLPDTGLPSVEKRKGRSAAAGLCRQTCRASASNMTLPTTRSSVRTAATRCIAWAS